MKSSFKTFIAKVLLKIKNSLLSIIQKGSFKQINRDKINKILIFKNGGVGDIIATYPAINNIRKKFKSAEIHLLTSSGSSKKNTSSILLNQMKVDKIINLDIENFNWNKKIELFRQLRKSNYDLIIILTDSLSNFKRELRNILFFNICSRKYVFGSKLNRPGLYDLDYAKQDNYPFINEYERNVLNVKPITFTRKIDLTYNFNIQNKNKFKIGSNHRKNITIAIGAKRRNKIWDYENFLQLTRKLIDDGFNIFFIGGNSEKKTCDTIINNIDLNHRNKCENFCGTANFNESIYIISLSEFLISNDSGAAHLSSFTDTKCITIQSSCDFEGLWYPIKSKKYVIRSNKNCLKGHLCNKNYFCGQDITVDMVYQKIIIS